LSPKCKSAFIQPPNGKAMMDPKTQERYNILLTTPAGAHRWCPRPGCDTPYIKADGSSSSPRVTCKNPGCELVFCYECRVAWHEGQTCEQFKAKMAAVKPEDEVLSETYAKQNLQECPNCNIWVEKIDGCEYVQCFACHHEFCWDCLEPHDHNMGAHVHGPNYKPHPGSYVYNRRRRGPAIKVAKYAGIGIALCVLAPPALAVGAVAAVFVLPAMGIHKLARHAMAKRKAHKASREVVKWAKEEKKRRQDLGLEVSEYVEMVISANK